MTGVDRRRGAANSGKALVNAPTQRMRLPRTPTAVRWNIVRLVQPVPFSNIEGATLSGGWRRGTGGQPDEVAGNPTKGREEPDG